MGWVRDKLYELVTKGGVEMRTDSHRPSVLVPSDYNYIDSYSIPTNKIVASFFGPLGVYTDPFWEQLKKWWRDEAPRAFPDGWLGTCDVCGTHFIHGDIWKHMPSGLYITIGCVCAVKYSLMANRGAWEGRKATWICKQEQMLKRRGVWATLRATLLANPELGKLLRVDHHITRDIRARFMKWGTISQTQIALLQKLAVPVVEKPKGVAPTGRCLVVGTIVGTKWQESSFGETLKMIIEVVGEDGTAWKAWGTVPPSVQGDRDAMRGKRIEIKATFTPAPDDSSFAFFKRPIVKELV